MSCSVLHHVELCVGDHRKTLDLLCNGYGFHYFAQRSTPQGNTWALRTGQAIFLVTKRKRIRKRTQSGHIKEELDDSPLEYITNSEQNVGCDVRKSASENKDIYHIDCDSDNSINNVLQNTDKLFEEIHSTEHKNGDNLNKNRLKIEEKITEKSQVNQINLFRIGKFYNDNHWTCFCCNESDMHHVDSVFNVALIVKDVDSVTNRVRNSNGGKVLREPCNISDKEGLVRYSIVSSVCGNIVHTLIDKKNYRGHFLPGFDQINYLEQISEQCLSKNGIVDESYNESENINMNVQLLDPNKISKVEDSKTKEPNDRLIHNSNSFLENNHIEKKKDNSIQNNKSLIENMKIIKINDNSIIKHIPKCQKSSAENCSNMAANEISHIDHVTFVCALGSSTSLMEWYEQCFGMKRFITNRQESVTDGFMLEGDIGLRLKAMEYWRCAETGLAPPDASHGDSSFKLVIAEALPDVPHSNVDSFLSAHGGPGVQHIGLHTQNILHTVQTIGNRGVRFRKPPPTYYNEVGKLSEITEAGFGSEVQCFQDLGILIDSEADVFTGLEDRQNGRYLMQIFSHPIFGVESFFLEIVQRYGAQGFGQGNIAALARSIQLYQKQQEEKQQEQQ